MKTVLETTDGKHVGDVIDENANPVQFKDGSTMYMTVRLHSNTVLANSHYVIFLSEE